MNIFNQRTIPKYLFPKLINRHKLQSQNLIDYYKQAHEYYVFTFFSNAPLTGCKELTVNDVKGVYKSPINIEINTLTVILISHN
ncbi:hypothetical protein HERIO_1645 [Hepatospora eriocheir]|uniref:Uncharacterized protein n=1 Tax=Hepatospora eriocheir TaxID=1081669 RepID=A0A1X0Q9F0_9MICR|nr:hypothetical protein HERIO_1645 [Hepatospora eriocheir]